MKRLSDKEKAIRAFYKFLYDNDVLENFNKYMSTKNIRLMKKSELFTKKCGDWLCFAIIWASTKEGHDFWCNLSIKWDVEYCR